MTEEQKTDYLRMGGCRCPYCKGDQLHQGEMQTEFGGAHVNIVCLDCKKEWTDHYGLTDVEPEGD